MFRQFSILCSLGAFLVLVTLLACDGTTGGKDEPKDKSSSSVYNPPPPPPDGNVTVNVSDVIFRDYGNKAVMDFSVFTEGDFLIDNVKVILNNRTIKEISSINSSNYTVNAENNSIIEDFRERECCEELCDLYVEAKMVGKNDIYLGHKTVKRNENAGNCVIPSSSSVASSSSALPVSNLSLSPVLFNGSSTLELRTGSGNKGFNLSAGTAETERDNASFYFAGNCAFGTNGDARLVSQFNRSQYSMVNGEIGNDMVPEPNSASQFIFLPNEWESAPDYMEFKYSVACPSAKSEWDSSCYLIYADGICQHGDPRIAIRVWEAR